MHETLTNSGDSPPIENNDAAPSPDVNDNKDSIDNSPPKDMQSSYFPPSKSVSGMREVYKHKNFDIDLLKPIPSANPFKKTWLMKLEVGIQTAVLFNSITTIMVFVGQFIYRVPDEQADAYGKDLFKFLQWSVIITPVVFFTMLVLMVNNYYSQATFYYYLQRTAIIDFPETAGVKFLLTHPLPIISVIMLLAYLALALYVMTSFDATTGQIVVITLNLIKVAFLWYKQQAVEDKFVTVSQFLQKFPDADGHYDSMDCESLDRATAALSSFTLLKTNAASYHSSMRLRWWKDKNYTMKKQYILLLLVFLAVGILAGSGLGFFFMTVSQNQQRMWIHNVAPCIRSCQAGYLYFTDNTSGNASGAGQINSSETTTGQVMNATCHMCTCECVRRFYLRGSEDQCAKALAASKGDDIRFNDSLSCADMCPTVEQCRAFPWYYNNTPPVSTPSRITVTES